MFELAVARKTETLVNYKLAIPEIQGSSTLESGICGMTAIQWIEAIIYTGASIVAQKCSSKNPTF